MPMFSEHIDRFFFPQDDLFPPWSFRSSNITTIVTITGSIHLAADLPPFVFLSIFPSAIDLSRELGLYIMYPKYDNLSLIICASERNVDWFLLCLFVSFLGYLWCFEGSSPEYYQFKSSNIVFFQNLTFASMEWEGTPLPS